MNIKSKVHSIKRVVDQIATQARRDAQRRKHYPSGITFESGEDVLVFLSKVMWGEIETTSKEMDAAELSGRMFGVWSIEIIRREKAVKGE